MSYLKEVKQLKILPSQKVLNLLSGNYKSAFKGIGLEVADLREYVVGDNVRHIEWKTTAKSSKTYVKVFQETRELKIVFAVNAASSLNWRGDASLPKKSQGILNLMYWLGLAAQSAGDKIALEYKSNQNSIAFGPKRGMPQIIKILKATAQGLNNSFGQTANLYNLLYMLQKRYVKRVVVFLFIDDFDTQDDRLIARLKALCLKHEVIIFKVNDPVEINPTLLSGIGYQLQDIATGDVLKSNSIDKATLADAVNIIAAQESSMKNLCFKLKIDYLHLITGDDLLKKLILMLRQRSARQFIH